LESYKNTINWFSNATFNPSFRLIERQNKLPNF
jgi:hypothetical protein